MQLNNSLAAISLMCAASSLAISAKAQEKREFEVAGITVTCPATSAPLISTEKEYDQKNFSCINGTGKEVFFGVVQGPANITPKVGSNKDARLEMICPTGTTAATLPVSSAFRRVDERVVHLLCSSQQNGEEILSGTVSVGRHPEYQPYKVIVSPTTSGEPPRRLGVVFRSNLNDPQPNQ